MPYRLVLRAQIALACAAGVSASTVARRLGVTNTTVGKWRKRYQEHRISGLHDELRPGRPRTHDDERVATVINTALGTQPDPRMVRTGVCVRWPITRESSRARSSGGTISTDSSNTTKPTPAFRLDRHGRIHPPSSLRSNDFAHIFPFPGQLTRRSPRYNQFCPIP